MNYIPLLIIGGYLAYKYIPTGLALLSLQFKLVTFGIEKIEAENVTAYVTMNVRNNTGKSVLLQRINVTIFLNDTKVGFIDSSYSAPVPANGSSDIQFVFTIDKDTAGDTLWSLILAKETDINISVTGSITANDTAFPINHTWNTADLAGNIKGIGAVDSYTAAQKKWLEIMGTSTYILTEPYGSLWKAKGKKVYVQLKERNTLLNFNNAKHRIEQLDFVDRVLEAGGDNIICVILK